MTSTKKTRQFGLNLFFIILSALIIAPFILIVSVSLSNEHDIAIYGYNFLPRKVDFTAYQYVLKQPIVLLRAYGVTAFFSFFSMILSTLLMAMVAYAISIKNLKGRNIIAFYLYFTLLFSGGLVPTYILITRYLQLNDTIWVYILPALISPWYVFMMRTFIQAIPGEIRESVKIDGGNEFTVFFKIILPLSKPVLATVALFVFLSKWNDWYTSLLYIQDDKLISLQYLLQKLLQNIEILQQNMKNGFSVDLSDMKIPSETVRMALAVFVAGPALFVFPFFQKYFVKGITVGSVKG